MHRQQLVRALPLIGRQRLVEISESRLDDPDAFKTGTQPLLLGRQSLFKGRCGGSTLNRLASFFEPSRVVSESVRKRLPNAGLSIRDLQFGAQECDAPLDMINHD